MLERKPHLKQHFVIPGEKKQPHLTSGASLYGRILIKAWENNIQNVNLLVAEHASNAVRVCKLFAIADRIFVTIIVLIKTSLS